MPSEPLGTNRAPRRRFWFHHLPLTVASAVLLTAFMRLPAFDVNAYRHADVSSGMFPRREPEIPTVGAREAGGEPSVTRQNRRMDHAMAGTHAHAGHGGEGHGGAPGDTRPRHSGDNAERQHAGEDGGLVSSRSIQQLTMATGYLAVVLLAVTLLLGPANLLLRRRNPVSSYVRRDVGIWAAIFSAIHVIAAVFIHVSHGSGVASTVLHFFVNESGCVLTNSFGLGNWTGLAALMIALGLLATSSDVALRTMKAKPWKWLQRLAYVLFGLVVLHAFFYGALLRITSPFTVLLILSTTAVVLGQLLGVWLWRRRHGPEPARLA